MGTASLATARTPQPPACPRGGFAPWGAATSPVARPFTDTPCSSPLWFPVPPLLCPAPLASASGRAPRCRGLVAPPTAVRLAPLRLCVVLCWVSFCFHLCENPKICLVPSCGPCLLFGAPGVLRRHRLAEPLSPPSFKVFRLRSAVRLLPVPCPQGPPAQSGFPKPGSAVIARRLPPPPLPGQGKGFLLCALCSWLLR